MKPITFLLSHVFHLHCVYEVPIRTLVIVKALGRVTLIFKVWRVKNSKCVESHALPIACNILSFVSKRLFNIASEKINAHFGFLVINL